MATKPNYNNFTKAAAIKALQELQELLFGKKKPENNFDVTTLILSGYSYRIKTIKATINTGKGGALMFIEEMRKAGMHDKAIAEYIEVFTHGEYFKLSDIHIIKK